MKGKGGKNVIHEGPVDISAHIEALRCAREETPLPAAVPSAPLNMYKSAAESIKAAKAEEFPVVPHHGSSTLRPTQERFAKAKAKAEVTKRKGVKKADKKHTTD